MQKLIKTKIKTIDKQLIKAQTIINLETRITLVYCCLECVSEWTLNLSFNDRQNVLCEYVVAQKYTTVH